MKPYSSQIVKSNVKNRIPFFDGVYSSYFEPTSKEICSLYVLKYHGACKKYWTALRTDSLKELGEIDHKKAWYPNDDIKGYFLGVYRAPSRNFPHSYRDAALTQKFAKWLTLNRPSLAEKLLAYIDQEAVEPMYVFDCNTNKWYARKPDSFTFENQSKFLFAMEYARPARKNLIHYVDKKQLLGIINCGGVTDYVAKAVAA
jgi:hypothetical protein